MREYHRPSPPRAMALGAGLTVGTALPAFLTAALVTDLTAELSFGPAGLGAAVALNRLGSALSAPFLGRLSDGLGAMRSLRIAGVGSSICAAGIALTARSWTVLAAWLVLAGCSNALGQPAANRLLANAVPASRLGLAFGVKQSAPPASFMLAGLSVPIVAATLGWRWAFVLGALLPLGAVVAAGPLPEAARPGSSERVIAPSPLTGATRWLLLVGFGFGAMSNSAPTTFFVDAAVRNGFTPSRAGVVVAVASATAVCVRLLAGFVSDRLKSGHLKLCSVLLVLGTGGLWVLAAGPATAMTPGVIGALAGTWGFNGVLWFALVRAYPGVPGAVTGAIFPGGLVGGMIGPTVFGAIATWHGYQAVWITAGVAALTAAGLLGYSARRLGDGSSEAR